MEKPLVLILCTGNSCRSHMAEGILRQAAGDLIEVASAGSKPAGYVHPTAIEALGELGIDISQHRSKHLDEFLESGVHTVITVCGNANDACPVFPGQVARFHWGFEDPPKAVREGETELDAFRRIRDEIKQVFEAYAAGLRQGIAQDSNCSCAPQLADTKAQPVSDSKPGLFKRFATRIDDALKAKSEQKAREGSCCGGDGKGGKCC